MTEEKRKARRFDMALPARVVTLGPKKPELTASTRDISSGGVLLEFDANLEIGTLLVLEVTLPQEITQTGPVTVLCKGHVVRVNRGARTTVAVSIERYEFLRREDTSATVQ